MQIGSFIRTDKGFEGVIETATLDIRISLVPAEPGGADKALIGASIAAMTAKGRKSARAGTRAANARGITSRFASTIPALRSRSAPRCSRMPTIRRRGRCAGAARARPGSRTEPMRLVAINQSLTLRMRAKALDATALLVALPIGLAPALAQESNPPPARPPSLIHMRSMLLTRRGGSAFPKIGSGLSCVSKVQAMPAPCRALGRWA